MSDFVFMYVKDPLYASQNVESDATSPQRKRVCTIETPKAFKTSTTSTSTPKVCAKALHFPKGNTDLKVRIEVRNVPHPFMEVQFHHYSPLFEDLMWYSF